MDPIQRERIIKKLEKAGRTCYNSLSKITDNSGTKFVKMLMKRYHVSVIEHESVTVVFEVDRGIQQELTRHRHGSYSVESTRYIKYADGITTIQPTDEMLNKSPAALAVWLRAMVSAEEAYFELLALGVKPQIARGVLPLSLSSTMVVTFNLRGWLEMLEQRTAKDAHPQIREVMLPLLHKFNVTLPEIFGNLYEDRNKS